MVQNKIYRLKDYTKPIKHRITYNHDELCLIGLALNGMLENESLNDEYRKIIKSALIKTESELDRKPIV